MIVIVSFFLSLVLGCGIRFTDGFYIYINIDIALSACMSSSSTFDLPRFFNFLPTSTSQPRNIPSSLAIHGVIDINIGTDLRTPTSVRPPSPDLPHPPQNPIPRRYTDTGNQFPPNPAPSQLTMPDFSNPSGLGTGASLSDVPLYLVVLEEWNSCSVRCLFFCEFCVF